MNRIISDSAHNVQAFHERKMAEGQKSYFALDPEGELVPQPNQKRWLDIHLRKVIRLLDLRSDEVFVDLGCGEGYLTQSLASLARHSIGLDFSPAALRVFKGRPSFDAHSQYLALASGDTLPLSDASVDKLLCNHMLEHVLDDDAVIQAMWRVLRPGGRALIGVPLVFTPQTRFVIRLRRILLPRARRLQLESVAPGQLAQELIGKQSHIRFHSLRSICGLLERHGFRIICAEGVGFAVRGPLFHWMRKNSLLLSAGTLVSRLVPALGDGVLVLAERD